MQTVKTIVFTFCLASLCAGVLLHLFPDAAAKRCMKAVAGLYIMAAVLSNVQESQTVYSELISQISTASGTATEYAAEAQGDSFAENILSQSSASLNAQYTQILCAQGYDVSAEVILIQEGDIILLQSVQIISSTELSQAAQDALTDYLKETLYVAEVVFLVQEEGVL